MTKTTEISELSAQYEALLTKTAQIFELSAPYENESQGRYPRALFVCSAGMLRSPTAAVIGAELGMNTRSCGTESYALVPLSANLIYWAETIYFVNPENYDHAQRTFWEMDELSVLLDRKSVVWNIEDIYDYMDPRLVKKIRELLS